MNPVAGPATPTQDRSLTVAAPYLIQQQWDAYTAEQHAVWAELVRRRMPQLQEHAAQEYLDGFHQIGLREDTIPEPQRRQPPPLAAHRLERHAGQRISAPDAFFEMLGARQFPTTTYIRGRESMEYTPEPDIFHDVFGHVPMHAHPVFADFLQHYGRVCARLMHDKEKLEKMGRLFWFTVEFGVIRQNGKVKLYGSGLISSHGEGTHVIEGKPEIRDFDLDLVLEQKFLVSEEQKVLYAVESFDQIYEAAQEAEKRLA